MTETTEGAVRRDVDTGTDRDALLFDFGVDSPKLGTEHTKFLVELITFLETPGTPPMTVSIDGFASRTGSAEHNQALSENREQAVESFLRARSKVFDPGNPHTINRNFKGFTDSPPGENPLFRSVRIVVHRPDVKPPPKPAPKVRRIADMVVRFQGASREGRLNPGDVLVTRLIQIYRPMPDQPFGEQIMLNPFNDRALLRVGRLTTTIGASSGSVFGSVLAELLTLFLASGAEPGKAYIHGSSSGGRNAIDFAAFLTQRSLFKPHLVAAVDAAFFQQDTPSRPEAAVDHPVTVPKFTVNAGSTKLKHNFFQVLGNHTKRTLRQGVLFSSGMKFEEIHGTIDGFNNVPEDKFLSGPLLLSDDDAHTECIRLGNGEAQRLIADDLLLAT